MSKGKILGGLFFSLMGLISILGEQLHSGQSTPLWTAPAQMLGGIGYTGVILLAAAVTQHDGRSTRWSWLVDLLVIFGTLAVFLGSYLVLFKLPSLMPVVNDRVNYYLQVGVMGIVLIGLAWISSRATPEPQKARIG